MEHSAIPLLGFVFTALNTVLMLAVIPLVKSLHSLDKRVAVIESHLPVFRAQRKDESK